jgi:UDP-N-acetylmuramoylalanine--D-glutamate ligase
MDAEFCEMLPSLRVAVLGVGASGRAAADALSGFGAAVTVLDDRPLDEIQVAVDGVSGLEISARSLKDGPVDPDGFDLVVVSPGIPPAHHFVVDCDRSQVPIISEIELGWRIAPCPIVAVTGTNGKSTVTALIGEILRAGGRSVVVAGNIRAEDVGMALSEAAVGARPDQIIAAEVSSFQLERVDRFRPHVAVLTNLGHDHLDRHGSADIYWDLKARIFARQRPEDHAVLPEADDRCAMRAGNGSRLLFGFGDRIRDGACVVDDWVAICRDGDCDRALPVAEIPLLGRHNVLNVLAAAAACLPLGVTAEAVAAGVRGFTGLAHRMEHVAAINGVRYTNNSMCTNPEAAAASVAAFDRPVILIAGGRNKGLDPKPFRDAARHIAAAVLIGASAHEIADQLQAGGVGRVAYADSMSGAVESAAQMARAGDVVILAPGCASFDMYQDFEHRGREFRAAVHALEAAARCDRPTGGAPS